MQAEAACGAFDSAINSVPARHVIADRLDAHVGFSAASENHSDPGAQAATTRGRQMLIALPSIVTARDLSKGRCGTLADAGH
ncbi:MAG: hypothetical protein ACI9P3_006938 [Bradyrhizobium sp.]